jgi:Fe-Mn family superoxide dismutase
MADNVIRNYTTDIHSDGAWASIPLLVLDVYEHAYYMDWGADRKGYIESWLQNINWENVNALIKRSGFEQTWKAA